MRAWRERFCRDAEPDSLIEGMARDFIDDGARVTGVVTQEGGRIEASAVVVTTGTFLRGLMHTGEEKTEGGRVGEPATGLSAGLARLGLALGRFKTGTPPRVDRDTVDYAACQPQSGDEPPVAFSFRTQSLPRRAGALLADGDKRAGPPADSREPPPKPHVLRPDSRHRPALLPFGRGQGREVRRTRKDTRFSWSPRDGRARRSTSTGSRPRLPQESSARDPRRDPGALPRAMMRPGYAVEYDFCFPDQLSMTLETLSVPGAFSGGADQRDLGLRGGGGAGTLGRDQRGARRVGARAIRARAQRSLCRRDDRRPDQEGTGRAVPPLHLARRVPIAPRRRHRVAEACCRTRDGWG